MLAVVRALMFVPLVLVARLRRIERRTIARLTDAGANTRERAILLEPGGAIAHVVYRRLQRTGALVDASNDRYYLNDAAYDAFRGHRQRRALVVVASAAAGVALLYYYGAFS